MEYAEYHKNRLAQQHDVEIVQKRWRVRISYIRSQQTVETTTYFIEELTELHDLVEGGENFYTIHKIVVDINPAIVQEMYEPIAEADTSPAIN